MQARYERAQAREEELEKLKRFKQDMIRKSPSNQNIIVVAAPSGGSSSSSSSSSNSHPHMPRNNVPISSAANDESKLNRNE